jgi:uncharacterized surface protein with fasciclin (FAS1) repeats
MQRRRRGCDLFGYGHDPLGNGCEPVTRRNPNASELAVTVDGDMITIGGAAIVDTDVVATNGVIHVIDTVLAPA